MIFWHKVILSPVESLNGGNDRLKCLRIFHLNDVGMYSTAMKDLLTLDRGGRNVVKPDYDTSVPHA